MSSDGISIENSPPTAQSNTADEDFSRFTRFLVDLATNPEKLAAFMRDRDAATSDAGLSESDQRILQGGKAAEIYARLSGQAALTPPGDESAKPSSGEQQAVTASPAPNQGSTTMLPVAPYQIQWTPNFPPHLTITHWPNYPTHPVITQLLQHPINPPQIVVPPQVVIPPQLQWPIAPPQVLYSQFPSQPIFPIYPQVHPQLVHPIYPQIYPQIHPQLVHPIYPQVHPQLVHPIYPQVHPIYPQVHPTLVVQPQVFPQIYPQVQPQLAVPGAG